MGDLVLVSNINKVENFCFNKCIWYLVLLVVVCCPEVVPSAYSFASSSHSASISVTMIWHGNVIWHDITYFQTEF